MTTEHLNANEYNPYYKSYIDKATHANILNGLRQNLESVVSFYINVPKEKQEFAYAPGKWTIKEILLHLIDTERIFTYRALRIARADKTPIVGYEQDDYVTNGNIENRSMESLLSEYKAVRYATIALYENLDNAALVRIGEASGSLISVRAIGYIIIGHENHHNQVIEERYL